jgi:hypothetical protein
VTEIVGGSAEAGFRSGDGYLQSDQGASGGAKPQKRTISMPAMVLGHWSLQATISHRPIVFVPEGSSLDRCVTLNRGIHAEISIVAVRSDNHVAATSLDNRREEST